MMKPRQALNKIKQIIEDVDLRCQAADGHHKGIRPPWERY